MLRNDKPSRFSMSRHPKYITVKAVSVYSGSCVAPKPDSLSLDVQLREGLKTLRFTGGL